MASDRARPDVRTAFAERLPRQRLALALVPFLLIGAVVVARSGGLDLGPQTLLALTGGAQNATPEQLTETAADVIDTALTTGAGVTFEIVQRQTIVARSDGPLIDIPDPADPTKSLGTTDRYEIGVLIERGFATPSGFWMEILAGPEADQLADYDVEAAETRRSALVRDGKAYRNDGDGWYATERLPGIGLDPITLASLPRLVRSAALGADAPLAERAADAAAAIPGLAGPADAPVRALAAEAALADVPGVIAVDATAATEILGPAIYRFDTAGRLAGLTVVARNTAMRTYDLIVETVYTWRYPDKPPELPAPEPAYVAPPLDPAADTESGS